MSSLYSRTNFAKFPKIFFTAVRHMKQSCVKPRTKVIPKHHITFCNGNQFPIFGLGTFKSDPGKVDRAVMDAIDIGYRHIDCAHVYENEKEVGCGINCKLAEGVVKREDIFVTSKLWNTYHRPDLVRPAFQKSLDNLRLDYLDLYLVHWPMAYKEEGELFPMVNNKMQFSDADYVETWKEMECLYNEGLVENIGLSNFNSRQIRRLLDHSKIKPVVNQIEVHPYLNQSCLRHYCLCHDIKITSYSPLGSPDRPWATADDKVVLENKWMKKRAKELGKSPAQLSLRWNLQLGNMIIPMSVMKEHLVENFNIFDFELTREDMEHFNKLNINDRRYALAEVFGHKDHPFEKDEF